MAPACPSRMITRAFGTIRGALFVPVEEERVDWRPEMTFPGLRRGETLTRKTEAPKRAAIAARGGARIVSGPADARNVAGGAAASIAGELGPPETQVERDALYARGFPEGTPVGASGLERALEPQVAGTPGGELLAGERTLAASEPRPAPEVRSTIDLDLQAAADHGARGAPRGHRRDPPPHGQGARSGGHRVLGATAARLGVQDHHAVGSARGRRGQAVRRLPGRDAGDHRRRPAPERERRVVRRDVDQQLRPLVQLGVRAARREARGRAAGRGGRGFGFNEPPRIAGAADEHDPAGRGDRQPARRRLHRDRPGQGAGHAAAHGHERGDDRERRPATGADARRGRRRRRSRGASSRRAWPRSSSG